MLLLENFAVDVDVWMDLKKKEKKSSGSLMNAYHGGPRSDKDKGASGGDAIF